MGYTWAGGVAEGVGDEEGGEAEDEEYNDVAEPVKCNLNCFLSSSIKLSPTFLLHEPTTEQWIG